MPGNGCKVNNIGDLRRTRITTVDIYFFLTIAAATVFVEVDIGRRRLR